MSIVTDTQEYDTSMLPTAEVGDDDDYIDLADTPDEVTRDLWPDGIYNGRIIEADYGLAKSSGREQITVKFHALNHDTGGSQILWYYLGADKTDENAKTRLKQFIRAIRPDFDFTKHRFNRKNPAPVFVGQWAQLEVGHNVYEGKTRNRIKAVYPAATA